MSEQTIAAIATPLSPSGIGMIRLSGPLAFSIAQKMVRPYRLQRNILEMKGYTALLGRLYDDEGDFDDVVVIAYRTPYSYTGEDVIELSCHGGAYLLKRALRRCIQLGARPAGPGEFTKRALLSGKLSLTQAEAVGALISSAGRQGAQAALAARDGAVFKTISRIKDGLVYLSASLAAWVDYPDEEQEEVFASRLEKEFRSYVQELEELLQNYERGQLVRQGISTVIVGRPNVGKSTLMNLLSGEKKSIVTEIPGTTRDIVESTVFLGDIPLCLFDTAGIREAADPVERAGVERARERLETAQLVLVVLDAGEGITQEDQEILSALREKPAVGILNKADLCQNGLEESQVQHLSEFVRRTVTISALTGEGISDLKEAIMQVLELDHLDAGVTVLVSERQRDSASRALSTLRDGLEALTDGMTLDAVNVCLDSAIDELLELTGERASQVVVDEVFSKFCVGK